MSFLKSKHNGWTWDLKRTPFGGGGGDPFSAVSDVVSSVSDSVSQTFSDLGLGGSLEPVVKPAVDAALVLSGNPELVPAFNATETLATTGDPLKAAVSGGTSYLGGQVGSALGNLFSDSSSSLSDLIGQDAANLKAQGLGADQIAKILQDSYGIDQFAAQNAAGMALSNVAAQDIAKQLASDYGANFSGLASQAAGTSLGDVLKYAKTGAQLVGGLGQLAGGVAAMQRSGQLQQRADPLGAYRPGYAAQLNQLLQNPQSVTQTPGYQFNLAQQLQAMQAQQAKQGRLVSGGALLEAQQYGQGLASGQYQQQLQNLAALSGATQSPAYGTQTAAGVGGQGLQGIFAGVGNVLDPLATLYTKYNQPSPSVT